MSIASGTQLKDRAKAMLRAAALIEKDTLVHERHLTTNKWFDYRFMSPDQATQIFMEACDTAFREKWGAQWNIVQPRMPKVEHPPLSEVPPVVPTQPILTYADFWRARQAADVLGLPYPYFIRASLEEVYKWRRGRSPRPSQVFSREPSFAYMDRVLGKWYEYRKYVRLMVSFLPQYRNEAFCGLASQVAHRKWVLDQVKLRDSDPKLLGRFIFVERLVPLGLATERLGEEHIERAVRAMKDQEPVAIEEVPDSSFRPACFLVPHAMDLKSTNCEFCHVVTDCGTGQRVLRNALVRLHGNDDPAGELRVSRRRKRRKMAA